jgi:hypothetical protein
MGDIAGLGRRAGWTAAIPVGVDGEALVLETPVRWTVRSAALRVRVPSDRPGVVHAHLPTGLGGRHHQRTAQQCPADHSERVTCGHLAALLSTTIPLLWMLTAQARDLEDIGSAGYRNEGVTEATARPRQASDAFPGIAPRVESPPPDEARDPRQDHDR